MKTFVCLLFVLALILPLKGAEPALSCATVSAEITSKGAAAVLDRLWEDHERLFSRVAARISSGSPCWLRVAASLGKIADAGAYEELEAAMSRALAQHPERVLAYLSDTFPFPVATVCEGAQIAVDEPPETVRAWLRSARHALRDTSHLDSLSEAKRLKCLSVVEYELGPSSHVPPK